MLRGKYLRERKAIRFKRRIKLLLILAIITMVYRTAFHSYSLFESEASSTASIDVAFFVLDDIYDNRTIVLEDMEPGDVQYCKFSIANYIEEDGENVISEADMSYVLKLRTTTNLPLKYELYRNQSLDSDTLINILDEDYSESMYLDSYNTYFQKLVLDNETEDLKMEGVTDSGEFYLDIPAINTYILKVEFPEECNIIDYQNRMECIEISIDAKQILDGD